MALRAALIGDPGRTAQVEEQTAAGSLGDATLAIESILETSHGMQGQRGDERMLKTKI